MWLQWGLNPRPFDYHADVLPLDHPAPTDLCSTDPTQIQWMQCWISGSPGEHWPIEQGLCPRSINSVVIDTLPNYTSLCSIKTVYHWSCVAWAVWIQCITDIALLSGSSKPVWFQCTLIYSAKDQWWYSVTGLRSSHCLLVRELTGNWRGEEGHSLFKEKRKRIRKVNSEEATSEATWPNWFPVTLMLREELGIGYVAGLGRRRRHSISKYNWIQQEYSQDV